MQASGSHIFADIVAFLSSSVQSLIILGSGIVGALIVHWIFYYICRRLADKTTTDIDSLIVKNTRRSARFVLIALFLLFLLPTTPITDPTLGYLRHAVNIVLIAAATWFVVRSVGVIDDIILERHPISVRDNLRARQIHTQTRVLSRSLMTIVVVLGVAGILMTFPGVREFGTSLLASAGIAGIFIGLASRATLANLVAGVQLAITQPIRIDDVVIVEGEWGWIEEIRSTFVVVKIWDDRRLVVPLQYFIEKPFQNWTRKTADLLGSVFIYADYRLPVQRVREEMKRIVGELDEWDGRVCVLQVTDAKEQTIELRALVSAADSPTCWDLRCKLREKLVGFLQSEFPECLPRVRAEIDREDRPSADYTHKDDIDASDPSLRLEGEQS